MRFFEFKAVDTINSLDKGEELAAPFTYTVKRGDSLWNIAKKHKDLGISYEELVASNPQIKNPDRIFPGEKITIPVKTANIPNVLPPDIERGRPTMKDDPRLKPNTEKPAEPKDDGSYDRAEKARLGNHTAGKTDSKDDGSYDRAEKARLGNHPEKASEPPVVPPRDTTGDKGDAGRGKLSPGPLGKGKYKINDYTTTWHVFNFFKKNNFNDVQAAAITANAFVESFDNGTEFNSKAKGDIIKHTGIPTAFGLFQWRFDRAAGLYAFAKRKGKPWSDLDLQLEWAMHELNNKFSGVVTSLNSGKNATDIASATQTFMRQYENPSYDPAQNHYVDRVGYAKTILDAFGTETPKKPA
jgi:spore coat assembly protein SafA